jgi:hypothetical protein
LTAVLEAPLFEVKRAAPHSQLSGIFDQKTAGLETGNGQLL